MKKLFIVIPLVFLLCFAFGCQKGEEVAEEPVIDLAAEKVKVESVIDQWSEAWKNEDIALFEKIHAQEPNCIFIGTDAAEYWTSWAEFRESILKQFEAIDTTNIATKNKNTDILTEYVRNALAPQLCEIYKDESNIIPVITIDPNLEAKLEGSMQETETGVRLALSPADAGKIIEAVGAQNENVKKQGTVPIVLCSPTIRNQFKRLTESNYPDLIVLSYNEIVPGIEIRSLGMITLEREVVA